MMTNGFHFLSVDCGRYQLLLPKKNAKEIKKRVSCLSFSFLGYAKIAMIVYFVSFSVKGIARKMR